MTALRLGNANRGTDEETSPNKVEHGQRVEVTASDLVRASPDVLEDISVVEGKRPHGDNEKRSRHREALVVGYLGSKGELGGRYVITCETRHTTEHEE